MKIAYSEIDQARIDKMQEIIRHYEESLIYRLRKDGLNWAASEQELNAAFMSDSTRVEICNTLSEMISRMMPIKITVQAQLGARET